MISPVKNQSRKKACALVVAAVFGLSACGAPSGAGSASSTNGPSAWTDAQENYLSTIFDASLVSSNFFSEEAYVEMGNVVCNSFKNDQSAKNVMGIIVSTGRANGLAEKDRLALASTVTAASVTYLCPTELAKVAK